MAAANLIARFEAKLVALSDQLINWLRRERAILWLSARTGEGP